ncbi:hypothetical protein R1A27_32610 (plasmid) [Methylobacterium sp. NMS12]|uniref:hypothetical protein n=1 Tax=Methylobacterium sp. NMS12 TaxID=3079766 RepID=UPI003F885D8B
MEPISRKREIGRRSALAIVTLGLCGNAIAQPETRSGHYDSLTLVVDDGALAGVFAESRGMPGPDGTPPFSCIFLLRGRLAGSQAAVETWFPGDAARIRGTLAFTPDGAALTLAEDHGGCPMTTGSMVGRPYILGRTAGTAQGWHGVGLVTSRRASLRRNPTSVLERQPYLIAYDPVVILERRGDWVRVRYDGREPPVSGWLPAADLSAVEP